MMTTMTKTSMRMRTSTKTMKRNQKTTKKTRTKTGSRVLAALFACALLAWAGDKKTVDPRAVIAGTVFRDPGFALPDATVILSIQMDSKVKKLQQTTSTARGEFSFRVAPKP